MNTSLARMLSMVQHINTYADVIFEDEESEQESLSYGKLHFLFSSFLSLNQ